MKHLFLFIIGISVGLLMGCSKEDNIPGNEKNVLTIRTNIDTSFTKVGADLKETSKENDSMSLFLFEAVGQGKPYLGLTNYSNIKSIYNGYSWVTDQKIYVGTKDAYLYAFLPYEPDITDYSKISIDFDKQIDYLYQDPEKVCVVNSGNTEGTIYLNHCFASLTFLIRKAGIYPAGPELKVERISIGNQAVNPQRYYMYKHGIFNAFTGEVSRDRTNTQNFIRLTIVDSQPLVTYDYPALEETNRVINIIVPPVSEAIQKVGDLALALNLLIDGVPIGYSVYFPVGTMWERGSRNIYNIDIYPGSITISSANIEPWEIIY